MEAMQPGRFWQLCPDHTGCCGSHRPPKSPLEPFGWGGSRLVCVSGQLRPQGVAAHKLTVRLLPFAPKAWVPAWDSARRPPLPWHSSPVWGLLCAGSGLWREGCISARCDLGEGPRGIPRTSSGRSGLGIWSSCPGLSSRPACPRGCPPWPQACGQTGGWEGMSPGLGPRRVPVHRESGSWALRPHTPGEETEALGGEEAYPGPQGAELRRDQLRVDTGTSRCSRASNAGGLSASFEANWPLSLRA